MALDGLSVFREPDLFLYFGLSDRKRDNCGCGCMLVGVGCCLGRQLE